LKQCNRKATDRKPKNQCNKTKEKTCESGIAGIAGGFGEGENLRHRGVQDPKETSNKEGKHRTEKKGSNADKTEKKSQLLKKGLGTGKQCVRAFVRRMENRRAEGRGMGGK